MKLDRFIKRPVLSTVISVLTVILGLLGLVSLPIEQYPDIAPPTVNVQTDNSELAGTLQQARDTTDRLSTMLANGDINVRMPDWDDFDRSRSHWDKIKGNK